MSTTEQFNPLATRSREQEASSKEKRGSSLKKIGLASALITGMFSGGNALHSYETEKNSEQAIEISADEYQALDATLKNRAETLLSRASVAPESTFDMYSQTDGFTKGSLTSYSDLADSNFASAVSFVMEQTPEGIVLNVMEDTYVSLAQTAGATSYDITFSNPDFDLLDYENEVTQTVPISAELIEAYLNNENTKATELTSAVLDGVSIETDNGRITTHFSEENGVVSISSQAKLVKSASFAPDFESSPENVLNKQLEAIG